MMTQIAAYSSTALRRLALTVATVAVLATAGMTVARADDGRHYDRGWDRGWRDHDGWRGREWREHEWREHEYWRHRPYAYGYYYDPYAYYGPYSYGYYYGR